jgi:hypothetical protein
LHWVFDPLGLNIEWVEYLSFECINQSI